MFISPPGLGIAVALIASAATVQSQVTSPTPDAIRVTVSINADGSRTLYECDSLHHRAIASTTAKDGSIVGKIRYILDEAGAVRQRRSLWAE
jgi:hypothetical protein